MRWRKHISEAMSVRNYQYYCQAKDCYRQAFEFNQNYYPGINAATLAWLTGSEAEARKTAGQVQKICQDTNVGHLTEDDRIWLFATEGEACLSLNNPPKAIQLYRDALDRVHPLRKHMTQSMYNQICRLWWGLGAPRLQGVLALFRDWEREHQVELAPGPFGNCTGASP
jgi:hypothetical protein